MQQTEVVEIIKDFYSQYKTPPSMRALISILRTKYNNPDLSSIDVYTLFPGGIAEAIKIAKVPNISKCM